MTIQNKPGPKSQRIVVDEIIDGPDEYPKARLLRADRLRNRKPDDLGIHAWGDEVEDCISAWRVEAFVGFTGSRKLREGDVFFVKNGSLLTEQYDPIQRDKAANKHLLVHWDESRQMARREIKKEFSALSAAQIAEGDEGKIEKLVKDAEEKIKNDR